MEQKFNDPKLTRKQIARKWDFQKPKLKDTEMI